MDIEGLSQKISEYIQMRAKEKLDKIDREVKQLESKKDSVERGELLQQKAKEREKKAAEYLPNIWLRNAAERARHITFATHAIKFTHTGAKGTSILSLSRDAGLRPISCVCTADIPAPILDATCSAGVLDVARLLRLQSGSLTLFDYIVKSDVSPLLPFAKSFEEAELWLKGFRKAMEGRELSSHNYAKQVYFPLGGNRYHLLGPLFATTLAEEIYNSVRNSRFSDTAKMARKAKKEGIFSENIVVDYPDLALKSYGGSDKRNVSLLNSISRDGKAFLFSCRPPHWKQRAIPKLHAKGSFYREFSKRTASIVASLKKFLHGVAERDSAFELREKRKLFILEVVEVFVQLVTEVRTGATPGWSISSNLSVAEKFLLDPYRDDAEFQAERQEHDWLQIVAHEFGVWINRRISSKKLTLGDDEYKEWVSIIKKELSLLQEIEERSDD